MSGLKICPQCGAEYELDQRFCPKDGTTLRTPGGPHDLVGSIVADRYHVLRKLGEGGMGQVYLAEHVKMGRRSAVKVMNPGMVHDADAISRFNREAANASRISHPNVAAVYDFGETDEGLIYLAMEFVEGPPLTTLIAQQGRLPPLRAADIARQVADALSAAHDMGIVHRDLKPDNIMVARNRDGSDLVKVVDFGIAKVTGNAAQQVTKTGLVVGTPDYMSPEQLAGDPVDARSDVYALALVTFNMLTGSLPFPSESAQETMILRLTGRPKRLSEMSPDTPWTPGVQTVMDRALARDANDRYQTAAEFARALCRAVDVMPGSAAAGATTRMIGAALTASIPETQMAGAREHGAGGVPAGATAAGKSKVPLIAAIATVVVLGGGGAAALMLKGGGRPLPSEASPQDSATRGSTAVGRKDAPQASPASGGDAGAAKSGERQPQANPPQTPTRQAGPPGRRPAVDLTAEFRRLEALTDIANGTEASAAQAWLVIDSIAPYAATGDDRAHLDLLRAFARQLQRDDAGACAWARRGFGLVQDTLLKKRFVPIVRACN